MDNMQYIKRYYNRKVRLCLEMSNSTVTIAKLKIAAPGSSKQERKPTKNKEEKRVISTPEIIFNPLTAKNNIKPYKVLAIYGST